MKQPEGAIENAKYATTHLSSSLMVHDSVSFNLCSFCVFFRDDTFLFFFALLNLFKSGEDQSPAALCPDRPLTRGSQRPGGKTQGASLLFPPSTSS
jgi:hypothetical protein